MEHALFVQKVRKERRGEYLKAHREPPPELIRTLHDSGFQREIIWMEGETTYIYVMAEDVDASFARLTATPIFKSWVQKMEPLLAVMQDYSGSGSIAKLQKVFDLEEHLPHP